MRAGRDRINDEECDVVSGLFRVDPRTGSVDTADRFRLWIGSDRLPRKYERTIETRGARQILVTTYSRYGPPPDTTVFDYKPPVGARNVTRKSGRPEDIPTTAEAIQAQAILVEVHKALLACEGVRYERQVVVENNGKKGSEAVFRTSLKRPRQAKVESGAAGSTFTQVVDGDSKSRRDEFRKIVVAEETGLPDLLSDLAATKDPLILLFFQEGVPLLLTGAPRVAVSSERLGTESCDLIEWTSGETRDYLRLWVGPDRRLRKFAHSIGTSISHGGAGGSVVSGWTTCTYHSFDAAPAFAADHFAPALPVGWRDTRTETRPSLGSPAPDFAAPDRDGKPVKLADFKGKPLLLIFFRNHGVGFDGIQRLHDEFSAKGIAILGVLTDRQKSTIDPAKFTFRYLVPADDAIERAYAVLYGTGPFLIDSKGAIRFVGLPFAGIEPTRAALMRAR